MHTRDNRVSRGSNEREMRKRRRQAIERQKGIKRYNMERELSAVTAELYISAAGSFYWFVGTYREKIHQCQ